ncbi:10970_t:CDS:2, partial [Ambispora gerdemannii]
KNGKSTFKKIIQRDSKHVSKEISSTSTDECPPRLTDSSLRYVDGKKYYRDTPCVFPVDERETIRNKEKQIITKLLWQGNFSAPIGDHLKAGGLKILDVGCGPGTWILEMAKTYPSCLFTGVDISPTYPLRDLPENVEFIQANILDRLPIESGKFDFVVMHFLNGCFTLRQWESIIIQEVSRVMKPGAWLEWLLCDASLKNQGENTKKLLQAFLSLVHSRGINPWTVVEIPGILKNSGKFVNIKSEKRVVTYSFRESGQLATKGFMDMFQYMKKPISEFMSITSHEYDQLLNKTHEELEQGQTMNDY